MSIVAFSWFFKYSFKLWILLGTFQPGSLQIRGFTESRISVWTRSLVANRHGNHEAGRSRVEFKFKRRRRNHNAGIITPLDRSFAREGRRGVRGSAVHAGYSFARTI